MVRSGAGFSTPLLRKGMIYNPDEIRAISHCERTHFYMLFSCSFIYFGETRPGMTSLWGDLQDDLCHSELHATILEQCYGFDYISFLLYLDYSYFDFQKVLHAMNEI